MSSKKLQSLRRPRFRRQFFVFLASAAAVILALSIVYESEQAFSGYLTTGVGMATSNASGVMAAVKVVLWALFSLVLIRALNALIFGLTFRLRKGYEAPSLIRNIFSILVFIALFVLIFKWYYPEVNLGALFT